MPCITTVPKVSMLAHTPKMASIFLEFTYFMIAVPANRPHRDRLIAQMLYIWAVALSMPRLSAYCMMNVHTIICAAT